MNNYKCIDCGKEFVGTIESANHSFHYRHTVELIQPAVLETKEKRYYRDRFYCPTCKHTVWATSVYGPIDRHKVCNEPVERLEAPIGMPDHETLQTLKPVIGYFENSYPGVYIKPGEIIAFCDIVDILSKDGQVSHHGLEYQYVADGVLHAARIARKFCRILSLEEISKMQENIFNV